jgi:hypothetical protein
MLIYVKELFGNLIAQLQVTQDADWISTQHADQLAIYHGVLVDKGLRAIEQLARFLEAQRHAEVDE